MTMQTNSLYSFADELPDLPSVHTDLPCVKSPLVGTKCQLGIFIPRQISKENTENFRGKPASLQLTEVKAPTKHVFINHGRKLLDRSRLTDSYASSVKLGENKAPQINTLKRPSQELSQENNKPTKRVNYL